MAYNYRDNLEYIMRLYNGAGDLFKICSLGKEGDGKIRTKKPNHTDSDLTVSPSVARLS